MLVYTCIINTALDIVKAYSLFEPHIYWVFCILPENSMMRPPCAGPRQVCLHSAHSVTIFMWIAEKYLTENKCHPYFCFSSVPTNTHFVFKIRVEMLEKGPWSCANTPEKKRGRIFVLGKVSKIHEFTSAVWRAMSMVFWRITYNEYCIPCYC